MQTRLIPFVFAAAAIATVAAPTLVAQQIELKSATGLNRAQSLTHTFLQVSEEIAKEAGGRLAIRYLGGPEVTPPNKIGEALRRGLMDLLHSPASYYNGIIAETDILLVAERTPAELRENGGWDMLQKIWNERLNARLLAWYEPVFQDSETAPRRDLYNLYFTRKPPLDEAKGVNLSGFRMRTTATYREMLTALGATPVGMPGPEIYTGLQRGVVQGFGFPGVAITGLGLTGIVKYRLDPSFFKGNNLVLMNLDKWKAMPQALRELVEKRFQEAEVRSNVYVTKQAKIEEAELIKGGMEIMTLTGAGAKNYLEITNAGIWKRLEERSPVAKELRAKFER